MGSRGVLVAPYAANCLYRHMDQDIPLPAPMDCARFEKRYEKAVGNL